MIIVCPECKAEFEVPDDLIGKEASCPCGKSFTIEQRKCPFCGEMVKAEAVKCRFCQSMLDGSSPHDDTIYRVLCILFGMIGIHDLYAGSGVLAGIKLLMTIIGFTFFYKGGFILVIAAVVTCILDLIHGMPRKTERSPKKQRIHLIILLTLLLIGALAMTFFLVIPILTWEPLQ